MTAAAGGPDAGRGGGADGLPVPSTAAGRAGLAAIQRDPARALIAMDFDGTLAPIVADPLAARAHPAAAPALRALSGRVGTLAVITGRPAAAAVELGGFDGVPGLIVLGHYGWEQWQDGTLTSRPTPPGVELARQRLPQVLADAGAPEGTWTEDKGSALAVHTRRTADPAAALARLADPLARLAAATGLALEPGRLVIELRPGDTDKGTALTALVAQRGSGAILFAGDDLGDLAAFGAVHALRAAGHPGLTVCSASGEVSELTAEADLVVAGPDGVVDLLGSLGRSVAGSPRPGR
jgi:trehalose 6-phosphate phosphatase